jgi:carbamoyltransferase
MGGGSTGVLGVSADYHDAAAAVVIDGEIVAAAEEERFTRRKHDASLPREAISWCLEAAEVEPGDLASVVFYDKPLSTWERIATTHCRVGPRGFRTFRSAASQWLGSKLWVGYRLTRLLADLGFEAQVRFAEHHQSHAAAAYYPSPFEHAAILTFDGVGEWASSTIAWGTGHRIEMRCEQRFPHSLGLFYSAMTSFCGFEVNDGEYKLMGLAPYGEPAYADALRDRVIRIHDDGSVVLDQRWFSYAAGRRMTHPRLAEVLGGPARGLGSEPDQRTADIARSVQVVLEDAVLRAAHHAHATTGERQACLAGGVALNCVANARLLEDGPFDDVWVQPAAGDSGSAIGAALWSWHQLDDQPRPATGGDRMRAATVGPAFAADDINSWLTGQDVAFERIADVGERCEAVARLLADGAVVGWFEGAMEFGPRALGHRSILADPRDAGVARRINAAVKGRESFRPFAPAVTAEHADEWFDLGGVRSPYMLLTAPVAAAHRAGTPEPTGLADEEVVGGWADRLAAVRSDLAACTHVDGSARVQTVEASAHPVFHQLIDAFGRLTGVPVLLNTSFNVAGEPIVCSPADAYRCFQAAGLDVLVLEDCIVRRPASSDAP